MKAKVLVLRDTKRNYVDKSGKAQTVRRLHVFPAQSDGATREMDIDYPIDAPPLKPYTETEINIVDWRVYDGQIVFIAR